MSEYPIYMAARALSVDLAVIAKISFWQQSHAQGVGLQNYLAEQATYFATLICFGSSPTA